MQTFCLKACTHYMSFIRRVLFYTLSIFNTIFSNLVAAYRLCLSWFLISIIFMADFRLSSIGCSISTTFLTASHRVYASGYFNTIAFMQVDFRCLSIMLTHRELVYHLFICNNNFADLVAHRLGRLAWLLEDYDLKELCYFLMNLAL
jgi:hypothetical protein